MSKVELQRGVTLIELLVAMTLSLVLLGGVIQLFVANKQSYKISEELARLQEGARFAASLLEQDIRMAGFIGCSARNAAGTVVLNHVVLSGSQTHLTPERGLEGWEANVGDDFEDFATVVDGAVTEVKESDDWGTSFAPGEAAPELSADTLSVSNSDVLRVWHVDGAPVLVDVAGSQLTASTEPPYETDDLVLVSDCASVDLAYVCDESNNVADLSADVCGGNGNAAGFSLRNEGKSGVHAYRFAGWEYYVSKRGSGDSRRFNVPSLYRREIGHDGVAGDPQELVEGVESLQFWYGKDLSADPDGVADVYVTADEVDNWSTVTSVRVGLLMRSSDAAEELVEIADQEEPPTFHFNGVNFPYTEEKAGSGAAPMRFAFVTTVALRSRVR